MDDQKISEDEDLNDARTSPIRPEPLPAAPISRSVTAPTTCEPKAMANTTALAAKKSWLVKTVLATRALAALAALLLVAAAIALMAKGRYEMHVSGYIVMLYVIAACLAAMLVEAGLTALGRTSVLATSWVARGLFYTFVGVITLDQDHWLEPKTGASAVHRFVYAAAWIFIIVGILFFLMGILCVDRRYRKEIENTATTTTAPAQGTRV